jgi:hypothetical protein
MMRTKSQTNKYDWIQDINGDKREETKNKTGGENVIN